MHSGHPGVDPYTTAVCDVYQDLYGEGSFTGKGIYDVAAFRLATRGRFPENTLLSHDLIEGNYARAGLVTDIVVYDDYPARYLSFTLRKHRWIRGDWQLLPWLRRRVPGPDGPEPNRLSLLSRWKILDNLRRSLVEPAWLLFFLAGWLVLPGDPRRWTLLAIGAMAAPLDRGAAPRRAPAAAREIAPRLVRADRRRRGHQHAAARARHRLPAAPGVDRGGRHRPHAVAAAVTRRKLLEWRTASQTERMYATAPTPPGARCGPPWRSASVHSSSPSPVCCSGASSRARPAPRRGTPDRALWIVEPLDRPRHQRACRAP